MTKIKKTMIKDLHCLLSYKSLLWHARSTTS
jgi:hypothetical protein